MFYLNLIELI
ncbi:UNVERIFIED_CONTAM: hypothetical protein GTU68_035799 [Idotea baltica]|nr:hypothetical protein [Idotea baltica]